ncbi:MAG: acyl-CoA dehydrogenase [Chloroflexi bacterium]|nr:acyl-CoA dehydrogenase [Chloroflexota bacterium]
MADNFFLDNLDLQYHLQQTDLRQVVALKEKNYSFHEKYPAAPRHYADAQDNYRRILTVLGELCATRLAPRAAEADEEGAQLRDGKVQYAAATQDALAALKQADLMGVMLPWAYGGMNLPETIFLMMTEMLTRADAGSMTVYGLLEIAQSIAEFGDDEIKARVLPRFARGEITGAMVLTEPDAGSDLGAVQTRATYDEAAQVWRINGVKRFITNGCADVAVVLARSEPESNDARGLSLFLVEKDDSVVIRRLEHKMGMRASPTCEVQYNHTPAQLIGKRRFGLIRYAMALMNGARLAVAAQAVGIAEAAYREAYKYAHARVQFNQPICNFPAVTRMLLSMRGEIEATRALMYEVARWVDLENALAHHIAATPKPDPADRQLLKRAARLAEALTPLVKYYATEMGNRVCYKAMQVHGGVGYMREFNVERHFRDIRVTNIYEGTSQLQVVAAIGKLLGHSLDDLLSEWAAQEYGEELAPLKHQIVEATELFNRSADHLKECPTEVIDYYASDLVDMATQVINSWLLLQHARADAKKKSIAQVYIGDQLPRMRGIVAAVQSADASPLQNRDTILASEF